MLRNSEFHLEKGDVVQIDPSTIPNKRLGTSMMVVTCVKPWGAEGYISFPGGVVYCGARWEDMDYVGKAVWFIKEEELSKIQ